METLLPDLLHALGSKNCDNCGRKEAKTLCSVCKSVAFCGKACQKARWPTHQKKYCGRLVQQKAKLLDAAAAAYAADEAVAADACRPNIPAAAVCYICLNQTCGGMVRGDLVRGCSCRGPHAGFVHIRCLATTSVEERLDFLDARLGGFLDAQSPSTRAEGRRRGFARSNVERNQGEYLGACSSD